jgi:hypothetical protein
MTTARRRRWAHRAALLLVPLVVAVQLQRGAAEAHHNFDAPLTIETPFALLPCDLALWAYPAILDDPFRDSLAALASASHARVGLLILGPDRPAQRAQAALDSPRAPPQP